MLLLVLTDTKAVSDCSQATLSVASSAGQLCQITSFPSSLPSD